MRNLCHWEQTRGWPCLEEDLVTLYNNRSERGRQLAYDMPLPEYYGCMVLSRKLAEMERLTVLNRLSEIHPIDLYTASKSKNLDTMKGVIHPAVDYRTDMPKIFHLSHINLNITMPSIESGIPLRVWDIMSVGGFCLTSWQEEIEEQFRIGREIEVYRNLEELYEKTEYYLRNEDQRIRIAMGGYQAIRDRHNYQIRLKRMLEMAGNLA